MKKKITAMLLAGFLLTGILSGCGESKKEEIHVFIAASLSNAMEEIKMDYEHKNPDVEILYNADSSGTLQKQIKEGAPCDIFFSAAEKQMHELCEDGYVKEKTVTDLLENKVVLIKPAGKKTEVTGFDNITKASSLALAGADVPVGQYAREIFTNMGILDQVMNMEINEGNNVTAVLAAVSEAANEVGVVYATDAVSAGDSVEVIAEAPETYLKTPVRYPVGMVYRKQESKTQTEAAKDFFEYLQGAEAADVFESYGFTMAKKVR